MENSYFGKIFDRPPISQNAIPGAWVKLHPKSTFIIKGMQKTLIYIKENLYSDLLDDIYIDLFSTGVQVVSGVNIYIEFRIYNSFNERLFDGKVLLHEGLKIRNGYDSGEDTKIVNIYMTKNFLFSREDKN